MNAKLFIVGILLDFHPDALPSLSSTTLYNCIFHVFHSLSSAKVWQLALDIVVLLHFCFVVCVLSTAAAVIYVTCSCMLYRTA